MGGAPAATGFAASVDFATILTDIATIGAAAIAVTLAVKGFRIAKRIVNGA